MEKYDENNKEIGKGDMAWPRIETTESNKISDSREFRQFLE
jgi:hypothetical protein